MLTEYHAKYYAHALMRMGGNGVDRLGQALFDAKVDLNPHQIEAALFALRSPLSKGVLLADEVGLGKTIEAGLILCQFWAEQRRRLLIICPASLRKQWALELEDKFNLPVFILDKRSFDESQNAGQSNPFENSSVIITSMHFAARAHEYVNQIPWHLVVIDEAHKLRNAYRQSNRLGQQIRSATEGRKKVLLTATPLQNSLMELYGLSTLIDEHLFADPSTFRMQYMNSGGDLPALREHLQTFCRRILRSQVLEYVKYTERKAILQSFRSTEEEHELYEAVSDFLQIGGRFSLPTGQRHLLVLLVRKVLASSPKALAGTLDMIVQRLERMRRAHLESLPSIQRFILDEDFDEDLLESLAESYELREETVAPYGLVKPNTLEALTEEEPAREMPPFDLEKLGEEIEQVKRFATWARSMVVDSKINSLLTALNTGFERMSEIGAARKVIIFTESKRTQTYIKEFIEAHGYAGEVATFNGTNTEPHSRTIYEKWKQTNANSGRATGSRAVDTRTAIIDFFRDEASILIATEAAAEGINLQFCSLVVNYDLPWNPQRIEQRIGRCHRYGQKHDVVVINFLNERNHADRRVYELLEAKFNLFSGVFGASDEVLGTMESGLDFERRVVDIYQQCRTAEEIEQAFAELQAELDESIKAKMQETREVLLKHFDEDVHTRLRANLDETRIHLDRIGRMFWDLTEYELERKASFLPETLSFILKCSSSDLI